jgi:hypothetical protein
MKKVTLFVITCILAVLAFGQINPPDMSVYTPATLIQKAVEALTPDVPYLNEIELRRYATEITNWKLNRDAGHPGPIPDPPLKYELKVDIPNFTVAVVRSAIPVCEKYAEPPPPPVPSIAGAIVPPFAPGRYLCVFRDNAPAGYRLTVPIGILVEKFIVLSPFGPMPEYRKVQ